MNGKNGPPVRLLAEARVRKRGYEIVCKLAHNLKNAEGLLKKGKIVPILKFVMMTGHLGPVVQKPAEMARFRDNECAQNQKTAIG